MDITSLLKHTSRSLYLSVQALPAPIRSTFGIAYLLCRYADTIADTHLIPQERRLYWIKEFPSIIRRQDHTQGHLLAQEISGAAENPYEKELLKNLTPCLNVFDTLRDEHKAFVYEVAQAVCDGMHLDLQTFPSQTAAHITAFARREELETYCRLMGGMPGLFWSKLIYSSCAVGLPEEEFYTLGKNIGDALQIVNILRDFPKDLRIGRCYFPQEDLQQAGLTTAQLLAPAQAAKFEPIKQKWIHWGREKLRSAVDYYAALPKTQLRHRTSVAWPVLWAADTLNKLEKETNLLDVTHRVKIPRSRIYGTMLLTPALWLGSAFFKKWLTYKLAPKSTRP